MKHFHALENHIFFKACLILYKPPACNINENFAMEIAMNIVNDEMHLFPGEFTAVWRMENAKDGIHSVDNCVQGFLWPAAVKSFKPY